MITEFLWPQLEEIYLNAKNILCYTSGKTIDLLKETSQTWISFDVRDTRRIGKFRLYAWYALQFNTIGFF